MKHGISIAILSIVMVLFYGATYYYVKTELVKHHNTLQNFIIMDKIEKDGHMHELRNMLSEAHDMFSYKYNEEFRQILRADELEQRIITLEKKHNDEK